MKKPRLFSFFFIALLLAGCSSAQNHRAMNVAKKIKEVSLAELSQPASAAQYEKQKIRCIARFDRISSGFNTLGIERYQTTHFLVSLVSEDEKAILSHVLIPAYSKILPGLRQGNLVRIEGVPHIVADTYVYVVVTKLTKL